MITNHGDGSAFYSIPWTAKLLADPEWYNVSSRSREPRTIPGDEFFGQTMKTDSTIPHVLTQARTSISSNPFVLHLFGQEWPMPIVEIRTFFLLNSGLNGYPGISHGGLVASLLDEVMGFLLTSNKDLQEKEPRDAESGRSPDRLYTVTGDLTIKYRLPVLTGQAVVSKARFGEIKGRIIKIVATLEDEKGQILSEGSGTFIALKPGGTTAFQTQIKGKM
jgi:acyl-coenzyme A thioesterase PaaI-like protein